MTTIEALFAELEQHGQKLMALLPQASRAFVIEFAGTPKSGKSTSVEAIRHFFTRNGFRVHVLSERAAVCPIPMKGHLFFNTWCASSMLAELLANVETETDVIIVDRGLFDALVWLTLQERRGELTADEARTFEAFVLLERWRGLVDLSVVMKVSAEEALKREVGQRLTYKTGSIMNQDILGAITDSVDEAVRRYSSKFRRVIKHDTTGHSWPESGVELAKGILESFEQFLDPQILVVPRKEIEELRFEDGGNFGGEAVRDSLAMIAKYGSFMVRSKAEDSHEYVQIIPSGLLSNDDKVFVFRRKESDPKSRLFGATTIWQGCHVAKREGNIPELVQSALTDRISRSLFLSRVFPMEPIGYCWTKDDTHSSKHFGLFFRIRIGKSDTAVDLQKKEFRRKRGHGLSGQFYTWNDLAAKQNDLALELWSRKVVQSMVGDK